MDPCLFLKIRVSSGPDPSVLMKQAGIYAGTQADNIFAMYFQVGITTSPSTKPYPEMAMFIW